MKYNKILSNIYLRSHVKYLKIFVVILLTLSQSFTLTFSQISIRKPVLGAKLLTKEEYAKLPRFNLDTLQKYSTIKLPPSKALLSSITLTCPPIGDQGYQGSCVGWASGYAALGILAYPKYDCWNLATRSPSYVFNQIEVGNCESAYVSDGVELVVDQGSCSLSLMPYNENECSTQPNSTQIFDASKHDAGGFTVVYPNTDVSEIKTALAYGYPIVIGFRVYESFFDIWYDDGIWDTAPTGNYLGNHASCIVGYDDNIEMFKVQNSWGADDGDNGFFWVSYDLVDEGYIAEEYVIYGMDQSYPESINGSSLVCSSGSTYTISNLPSGCSVSWDKSSYLTLSSSGTDWATFTSNNDGIAWIKATINHTSCSSFEVDQKDVWSGVPQIQVTGPSSGCFGSEYTFYADYSPYSNPTSLEWSISPEYWCNTIYGYGWWANAHFDCPYEELYQVRCTPQNACGTGNMANTYIYIYDCGYGYSLYPNPASTEVTITVTRTENNLNNIAVENTIFDISIYDSYGVKYFQGKYSGDRFTIPVYNLKNGNYFVRIDNGKNVANKQLIIMR